MAGYSGTPLPKKLGIKPGHAVLLSKAPDGFGAILQPLPEEVAVRSAARGKIRFDVILLFALSQADLDRRFTKLAERLTPAGGLWVCWPKKSSGVSTDLHDGFVREYGLATGLVDNKVCAVDETWSGLRFVIRVENR